MYVFKNFRISFHRFVNSIIHMLKFSNECLFCLLNLMGSVEHQIAVFAERRNQVTAEAEQYRRDQ